MKKYMMTIKETAKYMNLSESTVYRLVREGLIPGMKIGGQWRFKRSDLEDLNENYIVSNRNHLKRPTLNLPTSLEYFSSKEDYLRLVGHYTDNFDDYRGNVEYINELYDFTLLLMESKDDILIKHSVELFCLLLRTPLSSHKKKYLFYLLIKVVNSKEISDANRERVLYGLLLSFSALNRSQKKALYQFVTDKRKFHYLEKFQNRPLLIDFIALYGYRTETQRLSKRGRTIWEKQNVENL